MRIDIVEILPLDEMEYAYTSRDDQVFLHLSRLVGYESTCIRRHYGILIVKDGICIGTGFNGNYDEKHRDCIKCGSCLRDENNIPNDAVYEPCLREELGISVESEKLYGSTLYITIYEVAEGKYINMPIAAECILRMDALNVERIALGVDHGCGS